MLIEQIKKTLYHYKDIKDLFNIVNIEFGSENKENKINNIEYKMELKRANPTYQYENHIIYYNSKNYNVNTENNYSIDIMQYRYTAKDTDDFYLEALALKKENTTYEIERITVSKFANDSESGMDYSLTFNDINKEVEFKYLDIETEYYVEVFFNKDFDINISIKGRANSDNLKKLILVMNEIKNMNDNIFNEAFVKFLTYNQPLNQQHSEIFKLVHDMDLNHVFEKYRFDFCIDKPTLNLKLN